MLEQLAEAINKRDWRWSAGPCDNIPDSIWVKGNQPNQFYAYIPNTERNGDFVEWGLDRLEELGGPAYMFKNANENYTVCDPASPVSYEGSTRAEAVARALLAALEDGK